MSLEVLYARQTTVIWHFKPKKIYRNVTHISHLPTVPNHSQTAAASHSSLDVPMGTPRSDWKPSLVWEQPGIDAQVRNVC